MTQHLHRRPRPIRLIHPRLHLRLWQQLFVADPAKYELRISYPMAVLTHDELVRVRVRHHHLRQTPDHQRS